MCNDLKCNSKVNNIKCNNIKHNNLKCKYCNSNRINKMGILNGKQRYLCRDCKRTFREGIDKRMKHTEEQKMKVIKMYLENMGIRSIERLEKIHNSVISYWIRQFGKIIKERVMKENENNNNNIPNDIKEIKKEIEILEGDEIVTYIKKKLKATKDNKISGYGYLLTEIGIKL